MNTIEQITKGLGSFIPWTLCCVLMTFQAFSDQETLSDERESKCSSCINKYEKYLINSTWVVPPETLLAYNYVNGTHSTVSDQTVWVINEYDKGHFFGDAYTSIDRVPISHMSIVGSVTPLGNVHITFYPVGATPQTTNVINGVGRLEQINGVYTFVMQMNGSQNVLCGLSHWSYMVSVKRGDPFYKHLPGVDMSLPEFIDQF
jgi:hypothetical protein